MPRLKAFIAKNYNYAGLVKFAIRYFNPSLNPLPTGVILHSPEELTQLRRHRSKWYLVPRIGD
jgi:hypothetical protein